MSRREVEDQQEQIESLRHQVGFLQTTVDDLLERLERLELRESDRFSLVTGTEQLAVSEVPERPVRKPEVEAGDTEGRRQLAIEIGQFLNRASRGDFRGTSGRDRLKVANRCYIIVKDFGGNLLQPPLFTEEFATVRRTCKKGSSCGSAVFVGLATTWEAKIAAENTGLPLPVGLRDG